MLQRLADWVDQRTGHRKLVRALLGGSVHGGSRWAHVFGPVLVALFLLEAVTGIGLAAYYAPTTTDAWASVNYIQNHVALGWMLRGLHHYAASAMVLVAGLHILQTLLYGSYQSPRELTWVVGVMTLLVLLVWSHTGYLLPGDLRAYWATQVLLGITGNQPIVGDFAQRLIQGGPEYGNVTLTHFYALHVVVLPAAFLVLLGLHAALHRHHGATPSPSLSPEDAYAKTQRYVPHQLVRDVTASAVVVIALVVVVIITHGAELDAPADPAIEFLARPEWYFLPIFQLRHYFTGEWEFIATTLLPGIATAILAGIPFIHAFLAKKTSRARQIILGGVCAGGLITIALGAASEIGDRRNPDYARLTQSARELSIQARTLASAGVPIQGPMELYKNNALLWGERVFKAKCATCHHPCDAKPYKGDVCLEGYGSRAWLTQFMHEPSSPYFFGNTKIDEMDAWSGSDAKLAAIVEFVYSQGKRPDADPELVEHGRKLYEKEGCSSCHSLDGVGTEQAPDLKDYASEAWLTAFIRTPGAPRFYGELNKMDEFPHEKIAADEMKALVTYVRSLANDETTFLRHFAKN